MKKNNYYILIIFFICVTLHSFAAQAGSNRNMQAEATGSIRVMCYNIHHCDPPYNTGEATEIDTIIGVIKKQNPDIVALQEVDVYTTRSGSNVHQAKIIAERLGMNWFFAPTINYQGGKYGVAILSKFPLSENNLLELPRPDTSGEKRVLATSKITLPNGATLRVGCTHLDLKPVNRQEQINKINEVALADNLPFIITGDFNAVEGSVVINRLDQVFTRTCTNCPPTSPARNPKNTIDFIAYRDIQNHLSLANHQVVNETYASDHRPVVADFNYVMEPSAVIAPESVPFKKLGRKLTTDQPTDIVIYNLLGVVILRQKSVTSIDIPAHVGNGIFLVSTTRGKQKIQL